MQIQIPINCPKCGKKQEVPVWKSVNVTVDPELKRALFEGRINLFRCSKCSHEGHMDINFVYNDMQQEYWVEYYPLYFLEQGNILEHFNSKGEVITDDGEVNGNGSDVGNENDVYLFYPPHVVFSIDELLRYITFRDRLFYAMNPDLPSPFQEMRHQESKEKGSGKKWWQFNT
jgi:hypothetical protein